ncbi:MAG: 50S ribosomal protein L25 [Bacteroidales bacterium]|nr:50S ribosomal protein L25 [Bacteroidales bacterium]
MKTVLLSGSPRENVGKKDAKNLRKEGLVPCVIYGGKDQQFFFVKEKDLTKIIHSPEVYVIELDIAGVKKTATIKEMQFHPIKDVAIHVDFLEVIDGKPVVVSLPVSIIGTSPGVLRGGKLHKKLRRLTVKGLINNIPDKITVDISPLDIGNSIRVKDIKIENLTLLDKETSIVVGVQTARGAVAAAAAEEEEE